MGTFRKCGFLKNISSYKRGFYFHFPFILFYFWLLVLFCFQTGFLCVTAWPNILICCKFWKMFHMLVRRKYVKCLGGMFCSYVKFIWFMISFHSRISLFSFVCMTCLLVSLEYWSHPFLEVRHDFRSINYVSFMKLCNPVFGVYMFRNVINCCWIIHLMSMKCLSLLISCN